MFENFQNFLEKAANRYGLKRQIEAAKVCFECRKILADIFGEEENIKVVSFAGGVVRLACESPNWAQAVALKRGEILTRLQEKIGSANTIKKIQISF